MVADPIEDAVRALIEASTSAARRLTREEHERVREGIHSFLRRRFPNEDVEDAVDESIARFVSACLRSAIDITGNPTSYLFRTAERVMLDVVVRRRETPGEVAESDDPSLLGELAAVEDAEFIEWLLVRLRAVRDVEARRVLGAARDLAYAGEDLTVRSVAKAAELPPTTVWRALRRIRALLEETASLEQPPR